MAAIISGCGRYRYTLSRQWNAAGKRFVLWVMLNPSTADYITNDPTINRCIDFSQRWGFDGLFVGNCYAWRSTDPSGLLTADDPVGIDTDEYLKSMASQAELIVCGWGTNCDVKRGREVHELLVNNHNRVHCFVRNKNGSPKHPLYIRGDAPTVEYRL